MSVDVMQLPEVPDEMPQADGPMTVAADKLQEAVAAGVEVMQQAVGKETVAAVQGMVGEPGHVPVLLAQQLQQCIAVC